MHITGYKTLGSKNKNKLYTNCLKRDGKGEHILPSTVEHKAGLRRKLMAINAVIVKKK